MMLKTGNKGFTLMEVMVTTVILSLGTVLIYEAFFTSLNYFNYCADYFNVASWMDEKIWQTQNNLTCLGPQAQIDTGGKFLSSNKNFNWNLACELIDETQQLYKINLILFWQEGQRKINLSRSTYALYVEKK